MDLQKEIDALHGRVSAALLAIQVIGGHLPDAQALRADLPRLLALVEALSLFRPLSDQGRESFLQALEVALTPLPPRPPSPPKSPG